MTSALRDLGRHHPNHGPTWVHNARLRMNNEKRGVEKIKD